MNVRNCRDPRSRIPYNVGDPTKKLYHLKRDENNNCIYSFRDSIDIQKEIDSYRDVCSLEAQLYRMALMPTNQVINSISVINTVGADVSAVPTDLNEYLIMYNDLKKKIPDLDTMIKTMSFNDIIKSILPKKSENEVNINGSNESSNE